MLKYVNDKNFKSEVIESMRVTLVDFYANWCGPCKMIAPILERISEKMLDFDIAKLDVDENQSTSYEYEIMSIPTMMVFKDGKVVDKMIGFSSEEEIIRLVSKYVSITN